MLSKTDESLINDSKSDTKLPDNIGFCFLKLYEIPDFLLTFLKEIKPLSEQLYFDRYFNNDNYVFKGKNLFSYFVHENNLFYKLMLNISRITNMDDNEESLDSVNRLVSIYDIINE